MSHLSGSAGRGHPRGCWGYAKTRLQLAPHSLPCCLAIQYNARRMKKALMPESINLRHFLRVEDDARLRTAHANPASASARRMLSDESHVQNSNPMMIYEASGYLRRKAKYGMQFTKRIRTSQHPLGIRMDLFYSTNADLLRQVHKT
jgi:hypothetical protein